MKTQTNHYLQKQGVVMLTSGKKNLTKSHTDKWILFFKIGTIILIGIISGMLYSIFV